MTPTARLQDAHADYARESGDGFGSYDWTGANDYREEGYRLGEEASDMAEADRADWIDAQTYAFPESARYLVACAADVVAQEASAMERAA